MTRRLTWILIAGLILLVAVPALIKDHHAHKFAFQSVPGYKGLIGLGGSLLFIFVGKWVGKHLLQRPAEPKKHA